MSIQGNENLFFAWDINFGPKCPHFTLLTGGNTVTVTGKYIFLLSNQYI